VGILAGEKGSAALIPEDAKRRVGVTSWNRSKARKTKRKGGGGAVFLPECERRRVSSTRRPAAWSPLFREGGEKRGAGAFAAQNGGKKKKHSEKSERKKNAIGGAATRGRCSL